MNKSTFTIQKTVFPSEEQMIRMKLEPVAQEQHLDFDILTRKLEIYQTRDSDEIHQALRQLDLNDSLKGSKTLL